ncbi:hypothetical protein ACIPSE_47050 [Streptomyces sp. NPDC090106]|uniref:hypothetical protein n=1 Tax=Streptomyces sp. NPDC090106 TaxID=3365946 RepID=UPI0038248C8A
MTQLGQQDRVRVRPDTAIDEHRDDRDDWDDRNGWDDRDGRDAPDERQRTGRRRSAVVIAADGTVTVDGEVIATSASGDAAQTAVLDRLHQWALDRSAPVEASILDQQRRLVLRIRVREDGASELLEHPLPWDVPDRTPVPASSSVSVPVAVPASEPVAVPEPAPLSGFGPAPAPGPGPGPGLGTGPGPRPGPGAQEAGGTGAGRDYDTAILTALRTPPPAPESLPVPAPARPRAVPVPPAPAVVGVPQRPVPGLPRPAPLPVPEELAVGVAMVCETVTAGELSLAKAQASALERQAARAFGPEHLHTQETRALVAYVAHLMGDHATAAALSLQVAEARHRSGMEGAREHVERALTDWELVTAPFTAVPLGRRLLPLWDQISAAGGTERFTAAEQRISALSSVAPPDFARCLEEIF